MRQKTINGISIRYADAVGFAFLPCIIIAEGSGVASIEATISRDNKTYTYTLDAFGERCVMDYREYVQAMFDGLDFGKLDYTKETQQGQLAANVRVSVKIKNEAGNELASFNYFTCYVWGAVRAGEVWNGHKRLRWFTHFPFSFGLYSEAATKILVSYNAAPQRYIDIPNEGVTEFFATLLDPSADYSIIYNYDGTIKQATFDNSFDLTFQDGDGKQSELLRIDFDDTEEGIYLRWIDRHGFYRYWLFTAGDEERAISSDTSFIRNNLAVYQDTYAYAGANGRRQGYQREDTIALCAPLVDSDTYDLLQDVASSPVVDMYMSDGSWQGVTIKAGSYTKSTAPLQDFVCNLVLNNINIQQL